VGPPSQVSVASFQPLAAFQQPLERLGYVYRADNPERTKRYFREPSGRQRTMCMCAGRAASPSSGRCCSGITCAHPEVAAEYEALKRPGRPLPGGSPRLRGRQGAVHVGGHSPGRRVGQANGGCPVPATPEYTRARAGCRRPSLCGTSGPMPAPCQVMMWHTRSGEHSSGSSVAARSARRRSSRRSCWSCRIRTSRSAAWHCSSSVTWAQGA
jgi:hypothetical protein